MKKNPKPLHREVIKLLDEVTAYLNATGYRRTGFGLDAVGDGHAIRRWEQGRVPRLDTFERVRAFIEKNPPPK